MCTKIGGSQHAAKSRQGGKARMKPPSVDHCMVRSWTPFLLWPKLAGTCSAFAFFLSDEYRKFGVGETHTCRSGSSHPHTCRSRSSHPHTCRSRSSHPHICRSTSSHPHICRYRSSPSHLQISSRSFYSLSRRGRFYRPTHGR